METKGEKNNDMFKKFKNVVDDASKAMETMAKKVVSASSDMIEKQKIKNERNEIAAKVREHKYNIGKYIYDNEIKIDDGVIISKINTIDRLVDELEKLEEKNNG